jgi:hypothetical protein
VLWVLWIGFILFALWFLPLQVDLALTQRGWQATVGVTLRASFLRFNRLISISEQVAKVLEHLVIRWRSTGEPVKVPLQKTIRRIPRRRLLRTVERPLRYLGKRVECPSLRVAAEIGGSDAMQSALLTGACWAGVANLVGLIGRTVSLTDHPAIQVKPNYQVPVWRLDLQCILRLRLGHAILAGVWLLRRALGDPEIRTWVRDSWRRKGEEGGGRASNSRPHEDGHGEPQGYG